MGLRNWAAAGRESPCSLSCPSCLKQGHTSVSGAWNFLKCFAILDCFRIVFPHLCLSCRLESQMTADIQTILQLLQKQTTVVPPAYSMVTAGAEYQRPVIRLMRTSPPAASIKTDRSFSPSSQVSVRSVEPRVNISPDVFLGTTWIRIIWGAIGNEVSHPHLFLLGLHFWE